MFTHKKKEYYSRILGFQTVKDFDEFAKRFTYYLDKEPITKNRVMSGFFILVDIQRETLVANKNIINLNNIKSQVAKKYAHEILTQRKEGHGSQSISKFLYERHRVNLSRGCIEKLFKQNGL